MDALAQAINDSFLQRGALWALTNIPGFPPIIQTVHILGIAVVMATAILLCLRVLGVAMRSQDLSTMIARVMPWFWVALLSNFISGAFFVFGRPGRYFNNPVFLTKMSLLLPAIALLLFFHLMQRRQPGYWVQTNRRWQARGIALLAPLLLFGVAVCGRWIAYLEYLQYPLWSMEVFISDEPYPFWVAIENWPLSQIIAATNWFPTLETIHVIAAAMVVGSILWVDLRLLGIASKQIAFATINRELIPWTWGAFGIATVTGLGMFITRASSHIHNPAFLWKMALLLLAGANMLFFHYKVYPRLDKHSTGTALPGIARVSACLSLLLWAGVTLAGRWIGHIV